VGWLPANGTVTSAHRSGAKVLVQVADLEEARAAKAAGVDAVIAQAAAAAQ
jgi:NAD(P)H-dependent flavin oxidoreductase YrpB (nitropropane dioxygenase family)